MISVDEALDIILDNIRPVGTEKTNIQDALGGVLAKDICSSVNIPEYDNSSMDGFAVRAQDTKGASVNSPKTLHVVDQIQAGIFSKKTVEQNQAIQIMTGSIMPRGSNAVVMAEDTEFDEEIVHIKKQVNESENVRKVGENIKKGSLVIEKGKVLDAASLGVLASLGKSKIDVSKKPRVALLITGDEIIEIDEPFVEGKARNSNAYALSAQIEETGCISVNKGIVRDDLDAIKQKLKECRDCDAIITCGGVSAGNYDFVKEAVEAIGGEIKFHKIKMKPGKPNLFAIWNEIPIFGLPGNPVSSMVSFEILVKPALQQMMGCPSTIRNEIDTILNEDFVTHDPRQHFLRAQTRWEGNRYVSRLTGPQGSGILNSMLLANSLVILPENTQKANKGDTFKAILL